MQHNHQPEKYTAVAERHENAKSSSDRLGGVGVFHLPRLVPPYGSRSLDGANISLNSASTRSDGPGPPGESCNTHFKSNLLNRMKNSTQPSTSG